MRFPVCGQMELLEHLQTLFSVTVVLYHEITKRSQSEKPQVRGIMHHFQQVHSAHVDDILLGTSQINRPNPVKYLNLFTFKLSNEGFSQLTRVFFSQLVTQHYTTLTTPRVLAKVTYGT